MATMNFAGEFTIFEAVRALLALAMKATNVAKLVASECLPVG